jgi:hypothetical protein
MNKIKVQFLCFILLQLTYFICDAQEEQVAIAKSKFPDARAIILNNIDEFSIFIKDNELRGTCNSLNQTYINNENAIGFQKQSIPTNSFVEVDESDINAYTLIPKGKKYEKKKVDNIELKDDVSESNFYDDQKSYQFMYPALQQGSIINLEYKQKYNEPKFMGSFYYSSYIPSLNNELIINVEKGINIKYKILNADGLNIEFTKEEKKNSTVYKWKTTNINAIKDYDNAPNFRYYEPHIIFYITDYEVDGKIKKVLGTPKELYNWYYSLKKNVNKNEDARLKAITDSLTTGVKDEMEKVKKIFYWIQDNISYVAFEDGYGGFIPREAGLVYARKFGDCKDMSSITNEMLRMAGIKSYLTWIGSRDIPYTYADVPTPSVDNHMITAYQDKQKKWYFLDATGKKAPIDLHTSFIQGKQALVGISADSFLLVTVPTYDTSINQSVDSVTININGKIITGKGKARLSGYNGLNYTYRTEHMNKEDKEDYFYRFFTKGNNKVKFSDINISEADRKPLDITYTFELPDYIRVNQDEMYINLNFDNNIGLETIDKDRKIPVEFVNKTKFRDVTVLNIPDGYKLDYVPENVTFGNEIAGYTSIYQIVGNKIILTSDFYINTLILKSADFEKYNKVLTERIKTNKQIVSLIKK